MSVVLGYKFAAIPEWILYHPDLTGDDVRVYGVLARYGNDIRPAQGTIAEKIGKSADTVKRALHRLVDVGAVFVEARFEDGAPLPNRYHLAGDEPVYAPSGSTDAPTPPRTDAPTLGAGMHYEREQDNESKNNENKTPPTPRKRGEVDEAFEAWWLLYPKKKAGKGQARERWRKMTAKERIEAVDAIERHVAWWTEHSTDEQFIPAGNVWLNQRRWEDEQPRSGTVLAAVPTNDWVARSKARRAALAGGQT